MRHYVGSFTAAARSPLPYAIWGGLTTLLTVSGPFDTYATLPLAERAAYWALVVALSIVTGKAVRIATEHVAAGTPVVLRMALVTGGVSLCLGPPVWMLSRAVIGPQVPGLGIFLFYVFVVAAAVQTLRQALALAHRPPADAAPERGAERTEGPAPVARILQRVEPHLQGEIWRLSARNHYVEVHTEKGQSDVLLRFADGLAEVEGLDGDRVHRSHWVAWPAVASAWRDGNRTFLRLFDGTEVPVSRPNEPLLVERGLLRGQDTAL